MALLMRGVRGKPVQMLQEALGIDADGIFGGGTERAVKQVQEEHDLAVDGIAGPDTFAAVGLHDLIRLGRGSKGHVVERLQQFLGIDADGKFGAGTEEAVRAYQDENDLDVDGIVGPQTIASMDLFGLIAAAEAESEASAADAQAQKLAQAKEDAWETLEETTAGALDKLKKMLPFTSK